ncbi:hypothetical protein N802_03250 [Knoellia sinensis KCTC 19936]|uniref:Uncharacterized protein n=1 Tax=Knoellia sinensis KCTC 19936 TaxID=1385520 RepID=A0A0A0J7Y6_9MICO|nr:hypothetical protein [Knoellia sinensis]KGN31736.1 hypothetical protein N802_03250 [Knoellia sinensis KCTC 19936]
MTHDEAPPQRDAPRHSTGISPTRTWMLLAASGLCLVLAGALALGSASDDAQGATRGGGGAGSPSAVIPDLSSVEEAESPSPSSTIGTSPSVSATSTGERTNATTGGTKQTVASAPATTTPTTTATASPIATTATPSESPTATPRSQTKGKPSVPPGKNRPTKSPK